MLLDLQKKKKKKYPCYRVYSSWLLSNSVFRAVTIRILNISLTCFKPPKAQSPEFLGNTLFLVTVALVSNMPSPSLPLQSVHSSRPALGV